MLTRRTATAVISALAGIVYLLLPSQAWADGGDTDVGSCNSAWVCAGVEVPGGNGGGGSTGGGGGNTGGGGGGGGTGDGKTCQSGAETVPGTAGWPCNIPGVGTWSQSEGCYVRKLDPQPPKSDPIWDGHTTGAIYAFACMAQVNALPTPADGFARWSATDPLGQTGPTAAELAQQALSMMRLDGAKVGSAPPAGSKGLVGMPVWLWTAQTPNTWGPISTTASAGGLSVTATARVKSITWAMGDGSSVTCTKPGTPYKKSFGKQESPDCGHTYTKVPEGGSFKITATSTWVIEWTANNGETGTLPNETRNAATAINIGELQVVN
ncbi:ATP-binding protein [Streptomyces sp. NPDC008343]|uniref:ATP-binding protein n=1 Tax=Streptomyces sp. NPDC008343 TaxID=3364828 RepID=UPI0036EFF701